MTEFYQPFSLTQAEAEELGGYDCPQFDGRKTEMTAQWRERLRKKAAANPDKKPPVEIAPSEPEKPEERLRQMAIFGQLLERKRRKGTRELFLKLLRKNIARVLAEDKDNQEI